VFVASSDPCLSLFRRTGLVRLRTALQKINDVATGRFCRLRLHINQLAFFALRRQRMPLNSSVV